MRNTLHKKMAGIKALLLAVNLLWATFFEKKSPASSEDTQYITIILISTIFSPIEN